MWFCTCNLILNRSVWIIYLATIQLGTSLVFTFYHQGHWMSLHSNLTHDTHSVLVPLRDQKRRTRPGKRFRGMDIYLYTERKQKVDEHAGWWLSVAVVRLHSGHPQSHTEAQGERWQGSEGHAHKDSLHTMAPMFTADNLVSFQQLWGKLNLRKCSFSCPLDQTITLSPKVYKNICLQRTVQKININRLEGYIRTE